MNPPRPSRRPSAASASTTCRLASAFVASGFSQSTGLPASRHASVNCSCVGAGEAMMTASTSGSRMSSYASAWIVAMPFSAAARSAACGNASETAATRAPDTAALRTRMWVVPIRPAPMTPMFIRTLLRTRLLPATEAIEAHRDRDRHVDADHAHLGLALERPRSLPGGGEDRGAVGGRVAVDQLDRLVERVDAHDTEHRAEDLVGVDAHVGGDVVDQGRADPEAVALDVEFAAVDDRVALAAADVVDDPIARLRGDDRAHLGVGVQARADLGV